MLLARAEGCPGPLLLPSHLTQASKHPVPTACQQAPAWRHPAAAPAADTEAVVATAASLWKLPGLLLSWLGLSRQAFLLVVMLLMAFCLHSVALGAEPPGPWLLERKASWCYIVR